ncbi:MAG: tRNA modification GTPase MnmE [Chlamydiales bacterium]|nr:tRNA modification GTPase MnmE [Chlamydiales bacterium]
MEFVHKPYQSEETIAAISTPPGEGGISIIRLSGKCALEIASKLFSGNVYAYPTHTAHLGTLSDLEGNVLDQALLLVMLGPKSYTGEDTVELQCHGGMIASRKVLEACIDAGARAASGGEFTFKAFMNGKLDLAQAEAVQQLIGAKNEQAFSTAQTHLQGALSKKILLFQNQLIHIAAILEAWVDFPEEGIEFCSQQELIDDLRAVQQQIEELLSTYHDGKKLDAGIQLCIVGAPNVGKSSLMNALLDQERAIVTPIAGTTRDLLSEELTLNGLHFRLTDTAGIRETDEVIELEGIKRSKAVMESADLILLVMDATQAVKETEQALFTSLPQHKTIALWNKVDVSEHSICATPFPIELKISAKQRQGLDDLKNKINQIIWTNGAPPKDQLIITGVRHNRCLYEAAEYLNRVVVGLEAGESPEFLTLDLRSALVELGSIIGNNITEDILSSIFSQFCIGK